MYHHLEGLEMDDDHFPFSESSRRLTFTEVDSKGTETVLQPKRGQTSTNEVQYHPTSEKLKIKRTKHRRSGSHGSSNISPRESPNRDRRSVSQSETIRIPKLCEAETQTDPMQQLLKNEPLITSTPNGSPGVPNIDLDLSIRSDYSSK